MAVTASEMTDYPSYDRVADLVRDLQAQKFEVTDEGDRYSVRSAISDETASIHKTPSDRRWFANHLPTLKRMGFFPPSLVKKLATCVTCGAKFLGPMKLTQHRIDEHGFTLTCKVCKETGFKSVHDHRIHLAKHRKESKTAATKHAVEKPKVPEKPKRERRAGPVRTSYVGELGEIMQALDELIEVATKVREKVKPLYAENQQLKKKLSDVELRVEKVLGAL